MGTNTGRRAKVAIAFDATSATAHDAVLRRHGKQIIDLTPAAIGTRRRRQRITALMSGQSYSSSAVEKWWAARKT